jgi:hypothetical protein
MRKKTEMQKFVESLEDFVEKHNVKNIDKYPGSMAISLIEVIIEEAKKRLESEKEQIMEAFLDGYRSHPYMAKQYYKETYGGEE